jgi:hypothetical protein
MLRVYSAYGFVDTHSLQIRDHKLRGVGKPKPSDEALRSKHLSGLFALFEKLGKPFLNFGKITDT